MDNGPIGGGPRRPRGSDGLPRPGEKRPRSPHARDPSLLSGQSTDASRPPRAFSEHGSSTFVSSATTATGSPAARSAALHAGSGLPPKKRFKDLARASAEASTNRSVPPLPRAATWEREREALIARAAGFVRALTEQSRAVNVAWAQQGRHLQAEVKRLSHALATERSAGMALQAQNEMLRQQLGGRATRAPATETPAAPGGVPQVAARDTRGPATDMPAAPGGVPQVAARDAREPATGTRAGFERLSQDRETLLATIARGGSNNRYRRLASLLKLDFPQEWNAAVNAVPDRDLAAARIARFVASLPATALDPYLARLGLSSARVFGVTFVATSAAPAAAVRAAAATPDAAAAAPDAARARLLEDVLNSLPSQRTSRLAKLLMHDFPAAWVAAQRAVAARPNDSTKVSWERAEKFIAGLPAEAADPYYRAVGVDHFKLFNRTFWSPSARAARAELAKQSR